MIEEAAFGGAVDHGAEKAELLHRAPELDRTGIGALQRQRGEAFEAVGMARDLLCQMIVDVLCGCHAVGTRNEIWAGAGIGQHLYADACGIHGLETLLGELGQQLHRIGRAGRKIPRPEAAAVHHVLRNAARYRRD